MASIEKLSIRGIRAFSPSSDQTIDFYHPLTVIVGANGCGKTTIIECLKFSCTGSLPPGVKGSGFVHDPKIEGTTEVKANIRLRFRNVAGQATVVQRSLQVTQQKRSLKFQTLDGVIRTSNKENQQVSIGHKCGELDRLIPELLGVSKAIIDNVIFCHQEDSNWPLQEGSVLKKKFDDIFESARYTKLLDAIRRSKQEKNLKAKELKGKAEVLLVLKNKALELQEKIDSCVTKTDLTKEKMHKMSKSIDTAEEQVKDHQQQLTELNELNQAISRVKDQIRHQATLVQQTYGSIDNILTDSTQELEAIQRNYDAIADQQQDRVNELHQQEKQTEDEIKDKRTTYTRLCMNQGKLQSALDRYDKLKAERLNFVQELSLQHDFGVFNDTSEGGIEAFSCKFNMLLQQKMDHIKSLGEKKAQEESEINRGITALHSELHHHREQIKAQQRQIGIYEQDLTPLQQNLQRIRSGPCIDEELFAVEKQLAGLKAKAAPEKHSQDIQQIQVDIQDTEKELNELKFQANRANKQLKALRESSEAQQRYQLELEQHQKAQTVYEKELDDYKRTLVGKNQLEGLQEAPTADICLSSAQKLARDQEKQLKKLTTSEANDAKLLMKAQYDLQTVKSAIQKLQHKEHTLQEQTVLPLQTLLTEIYPSESYNSMASVLALNFEAIEQDLEAKLADARDVMSEEQHKHKTLTRWKAKGIQKGLCPMCLREFESDEKETFVNVLDEYLDPEKRQRKKQKALDRRNLAEANCIAFGKQKLAFHEYKQIVEVDLPQATAEYEALMEKETRLNAKVAEHKMKVEEMRSTVEECQDAVVHFRQFQKQQTQLHQQLQQLQLQEQQVLGSGGAGGNSKTSIRALEEEAENTRQSMAQVQDRFNTKQIELTQLVQAHQALEKQLFGLRQQQTKLQDEKKELEQSKTKEQALQQQLRDTKAKLVDLQNQLAPMEEAYHEKAMELNCFTAEQTKLLHTEEQKKLALEEKARQLQSFQHQLQLEKVADCQAEMAELQKTMAATQQEQDALQEKLSKQILPELQQAQTVLNEKEQFRKTLRENLAYRNLQDKLRELRDHEEGLQRQLATCPYSKDILLRQVEMHQKELTSLRDERSKLNGRIEELNDQIKQYKKELKSPDLDGIDKRHQIANIDHSVTQMIVGDLDKYYKAVDNALIDYHSKKIKEINSIIKELWQMTYRGEDIETIEIVSGIEGTSRVSSRAYNYRVSMRKGDTDLDMRGRCSAGQKVLAGLVIRLALAETFCLNAGILCLDEPTTNLDENNKIGLAQALSDIITARSKQRNFQLVCITHDEDFVRILANAQLLGGTNPGYCWRISREKVGDNQYCSKIERQDWADI